MAHALPGFHWSTWARNVLQGSQLLGVQVGLLIIVQYHDLSIDPRVGLFKDDFLDIMCCLPVDLKPIQKFWER